MINYREHRGSLKESLATAKQFNSFEDFYKYVKFKKIEKYGYDPRVTQELFIVTNEHDHVVGFFYFKGEHDGRC